MTRSLKLSSALCLFLCWAMLPPGGVAEEADQEWAPPPLDEVVRIFDQEKGEEISLEELIDAVASDEIVLLGETHLDETTHRLERAVYEGLIRHTEGKVVLSLEMFERDVQPVLDSYLAGEIPEAEFLARARPWGNYRTGYRPLIELARERGLPVVAANVPTALRTRIAFGGKGVLAELPEEERAWVADELLPEADSYWERFARTVRGHMRMMLAGDPERRLTSSQSLWDNTMAESCLRALESHPGWVVLHVNGGFHSQYREGMGTQILARRPSTRLAVIDVAPTSDLSAVTAWSSPERGDFLVAAESRARGISEGFHAVDTARELRYRLHVPARASDQQKASLLVWLPDDGFRALDGLRRCRQVVGPEVAVAVVELPYPGLEEDLAQGGRLYWPETFSEDLQALQVGLARMMAYVVRNFPVDPERLLLAGEGSGATVVAGVALHGGPSAPPALAASPRRYAKLRTLPLPAPPEEQEGEAPAPRLTVLAAPQDRDWWEEEAQEYTGAGVPTEVIEGPASRWERDRATTRALREALGLEEEAPPAGEEGAPPPLLLVHVVDSIRSRAWAFGLARRQEAEGRAVQVVPLSGLAAFLEGEAGAGEWELQPLALAGEAFDPGELPERVTLREPWGPADLADGRALPLAAGPFGGTTVLVVPTTSDEPTRAAYRELAAKQVLSARSRFARLEVVVPGESPGLADVLAPLQGGLRSSVAIVPAAFCAGADEMRALREEVAPLEDLLSVEWVPGLGGALPLRPGGGEDAGGEGSEEEGE